MQWHILKEAAYLWHENDADYVAAAVSYYAIFAIVPLILLSLLVGSFIYPYEYVVSFLEVLGSVMGEGVVQMVSIATTNLAQKTEFLSVPIIGALFFSGMVVILCNTITAGIHLLWGIPHRGFKGWLRKCWHAVEFIVVFETYIIGTIAFSIMLHSVDGYTPLLLQYILNTLFFVAATTILFSLAYHILPWKAVSLRNRLIGALVAALLLSLVKVGVTWYLTITPFPDLFEAAGKIIVLLMWGYATACVFFYGAAVTHVLEKYKHSR